MTAQAQHVDLLSRSTLFDATWYGMQYPDVALLGLQPAEHYLRYGALLLRDPSPGFSTRQYLEANPDVAAAGVNALVHYLEHGRKESRSLSPHTATPDLYAEAVDVVVPVFNALEDVKQCLEAVRTRKDGFLVRCIVVNDGSNEETGDWLRRFSAEHADTFALIEHPKNLGYTKAVNTGLRASKAPYVITLNSDTIVTRGWLRGLVRCMHSDPTVGIVGPLSNAASWQNVPSLYDRNGAFAVNELPPGMTADDMAGVVASASCRAYPRMPFVNGFCFMVRRAVIESVGYMDEENFPVGYGEENDFCMRAADAGFALAIADDTYVFHAKSKSFGHERRKDLSAKGSETLKRKHTAAKVNALVQAVKVTEPLDRIRDCISKLLDESHRPADMSIDPMSMRILFLLPVRGGGGGANSVMQEVSEMCRLGVQARVAVRADDRRHIVESYADVPNVEKIVIGFEESDIVGIAEDYDVVVGTIFSSMKMVQGIVNTSPHILPAYYVQDYEPLFFAPGSENWNVARQSYSLIPDAIFFAKTDWIARKVIEEHGHAVQKVQPSIDHQVYKPCVKPSDGRVHIAAMIRPQTPYRGAERTMRVFSRLSKENPGKLCFHLFGCPSESPHFQGLTRDFEFVNHGVLRRHEVAAILGRAHVFTDFSDYQAFGRTALEAMSSGCAVLVPIHGGGDEYAIDGVNAFVVDPFDEDECFDRLSELIHGDAQMRKLQRAGLVTSARYSTHAAAISELIVLAQGLATHRKHHPVAERPKALLLPAVRKDMVPAGSAYVRVLLPYAGIFTRRHWRVSVSDRDRLPTPGQAEVLLVQREVDLFEETRFDAWLAAWRSAGGRLIYEIDDDLLNPEALVQRRYSGDTAALLRQVGWFARNADVVTVSTRPLAEKLRNLGANVHVVPNRLDAELWRLEESRDHSQGPYARSDEVVRIGYIGTATHDQDLEVVTSAVRRIELEYGGRVAVEVIGGFQHRTASFGRRVALPKKTDYPSFAKWLHERVHWDIGLIPLADDEFNRSKSNLKFLEYAALDMAIICSDVESYRDVARNEVNALVVPNRSEEWYGAMKRLIEQRKLRRQLASSAREQVARDFTIAAGASDYLCALRSFRGNGRPMEAYSAAQGR